MPKGMKVVHKITGLDKLNKKLLKLQTDALSHQIKAVQDSTFLIHETAVGLIQDNTSGTPQRRYSKSGKPRMVLVSKPGEAPNTDTGRLVQSIKFDFKNGGLIGRVGTNLKYGAWLEFGTRAMEARPWLSEAVRLVSKDVAAVFERAFKKTVDGVSE